MFRCVASLVVLLASSGGVLAQGEPVGSEVNPTTSVQPHFSSIGASLWGLSAAETEKLNAVIRVEQAFTDVEHLTPFEILGKYAETETERRAYAKRYIEANIQHQIRSLRWAVSVADQVKSGREKNAIGRDPVINKYLSNAFTSNQQPKTPALLSERFHLFVDVNGCAGCKEISEQAFSALKNGLIDGVDVVFVGMNTDNKSGVVKWLQSRNVDPKLIQEGRVTLNRDSPEWVEERKGSEPPYLFSTNSGVVDIR